MVEWDIKPTVYNISDYVLELFSNGNNLTGEKNVSDGTTLSQELTDIVLGQSYSVIVRSASRYGDAPVRLSASNLSEQQRTGTSYVYFSATMHLLSS